MGLEEFHGARDRTGRSRRRFMVATEASLPGLGGVKLKIDLGILGELMEKCEVKKRTVEKRRKKERREEEIKKKRKNRQKRKKRKKRRGGEKNRKKSKTDFEDAREKKPREALSYWKLPSLAWYGGSVLGKGHDPLYKP